MRTLQIYSDGGARGNPGPAGIGVIIQNAKCKSQSDNANCRIFDISKYIGEKTNNQAEYLAVIAALEWVSENIKEQDINIECFLDSQLVVEQLNQRYKLKNEGLKPLFWQIRELVMKVGGKVTFQYIPREQNHEADKLVNLALDKHAKGEK